MIILQLTVDELKIAMKAAAQEAVEAALKNAHNLKDDLLSKRDTAKYLGVSLTTITQWEKSGYLTAQRKGSRVYFRRSELLQP